MYVSMYVLECIDIHYVYNYIHDKNVNNSLENVRWILYNTTLEWKLSNIMNYVYIRM